jgi:transcriptional regulator with XRE-family HTH domain
MPTLGARLKATRLAKKLTLEALAARTQLTKGFISQLEGDTKSPSVATLISISSQLGVTISYLLNGSARPVTSFSLVKRNERKPIKRFASRFGATYEALAHKRAVKAMEPFVISPPLKAPTEYFEHPGDEMIYVLSGRIRVWLEKKSFDLEIGDCLYYNGQTPHRSQSVGKVRAKAIMIVSMESVTAP